MSSNWIDFFFQPHSIAIFGASTNPNKSGYKLAQNLLSHNYPGKVFLINPTEYEAFKKLLNTICENMKEFEIEVLIIIA